jgi:parallel beta-helix repeat protein
MGKKTNQVVILFIVLSLVGNSIHVLANVAHPSSTLTLGQILYVDDDNSNGPWTGSKDHPFQQIQDAINFSENGDTVYIYNGTYNQTLIIFNSITLLGEGSVIVDGGYHDSVITVLADNVTIQQLLIKNSAGYDDNAALRIQSNHTIIKHCVIYKTRIGLYATHSSDITIDNCTIHNNGKGIQLSSSDDIAISGCTIAGNSIGIHIENSHDAHISHSYLFGNGRACFFHSSQTIKLVHCNISDNSANHGGIFIHTCSGIDITNCIFSDNGIGANIEKSDLITITKSTLDQNSLYALWMDHSCSNITVSTCEITNNLRFGIYKPSDTRCNVSYNNIYGNNLYGIYARQSHCSSPHNYWGSPFGPSYTEFGKGDRITFSMHRIHYWPWQLTAYENNGADWDFNRDFMDKPFEVPINTPISFNELDTDEDGVPDWWEIKWGYDPYCWDDHTNLDPDKDGLNNIEECYTDPYGSNPFQKDIFLEIDWVESQTGHSNKPTQDMIQQTVSIFQQHNISLHIDVGTLGGGEEIPYVNYFSFSTLNKLYWDYFLHNDLNNPRKGIFHYGIICDVGPDVNFPFIGWDTFDSFLISAELLKQQKPLMDRDRLVMSATIHQLGHTLNLLADTYEGIDNLGTLMPFSLQWLKYLNYKSSMNYYYKFKTFSYSDGTNGYGDFDDWGHLDFSFFKTSCFTKQN